MVVTVSEVEIHCRNCRMRLHDKCLGYREFSRQQPRDLPPEPFSGCIIPIVEGYIAQIKSGHRVLEIGCGSWSAIKDHCDMVGAHYEGIDGSAQYMGIPTVATRVENLAKLSFQDKSFDFVIGNQTMEHWAEYGCPTEWGLYQCFRVAKEGGSVFLNVPIHFHGVKPFITGDVEKIKEMFKDFAEYVLIDSWAKTTEPLPAFFAHPAYGPLANAHAYTIDIRAIRGNGPLLAPTRGIGWTGLMALLVNYPFGYLLYQLKKRISCILRIR